MAEESPQGHHGSDSVPTAPGGDGQGSQVLNPGPWPCQARALLQSYIHSTGILKTVSPGSPDCLKLAVLLLQPLEH